MNSQVEKLNAVIASMAKEITELKRRKSVGVVDNFNPNEGGDYCVSYNPGDEGYFQKADYADWDGWLSAELQLFPSPGADGRLTPDASVKLAVWDGAITNAAYFNLSEIQLPKYDEKYYAGTVTDFKRECEAIIEKLELVIRQLQIRMDDIAE